MRKGGQFLHDDCFRVHSTDSVVRFLSEGLLSNSDQERRWCYAPSAECVPRLAKGPTLRLRCRRRGKASKKFTGYFFEH